MNYYMRRPQFVWSRRVAPQLALSPIPHEKPRAGGPPHQGRRLDLMPPKVWASDSHKRF
jgi:hypothetical protein